MSGYYPEMGEKADETKLFQAHHASGSTYGLSWNICDDEGGIEMSTVYSTNVSPRYGATIDTESDGYRVSIHPRSIGDVDSDLPAGLRRIDGRLYRRLRDTRGAIRRAQMKE